MKKNEQTLPARFNPLPPFTLPPSRKGTILTDAQQWMSSWNTISRAQRGERCTVVLTAGAYTAEQQVRASSANSSVSWARQVMRVTVGKQQPNADSKWQGSRLSVQG